MSRRHPGDPEFHLRRLWPIAILLLAFTLRVIALDRVPPGLSHDEAYNGIAALDVLGGPGQSSLKSTRVSSR